MNNLKKDIEHLELLINSTKGSKEHLELLKRTFLKVKNQINN